MLTALRFGNVRLEGKNAPSSLTNRAANELMEYLVAKRTLFDLPLYLDGSAFEQEVWSYLRTIPYGQVRTFGQIAEAIGHPGAHRAVAIAVSKNPLPVIVPGHRAVSRAEERSLEAVSDPTKKFLLKLEQRSGA